MAKTEPLPVSGDPYIRVTSAATGGTFSSRLPAVRPSRTPPRGRRNRASIYRCLRPKVVQRGDVEAFSDAGLSAEWDAAGLIGRGLVIGTAAS